MKKILTALFIGFFSFAPALAFAATTIDNFDSYSSVALGSVSGTPWTCINVYDYIVENTTFTLPITSGTNGIMSTSTTGACGKTITAATTGVFSVSLDNTDTGSTNEFRLRNGSNLTRVSIGLLSNAAFYRDSGGTGHTFAQNLSLNQFHTFEIEINTTGDLFKVRVDGGNTTDWVGMQNAGATSIQQVRFIPTSVGANIFYADNITYDSAATLNTAAAGTTSSGYSPSKEEFLFLFAIVLFLGSVPFWERTMSINRQRYAA